jgi:hypothetical protein
MRPAFAACDQLRLPTSADVAIAAALSRRGHAVAFIANPSTRVG